MIVNTAWANEEIDFVNNIELLSNDFKEYKGVKLENKDESIINEECSELMLRDKNLHSDCVIFFKKLALKFKIDEQICRKKAKRLASSVKNKNLVLIDEEGVVKRFIIKDGLYSEAEEYEKCMEKLEWRDATDFRFGKTE